MQKFVVTKSSQFSGDKSYQTPSIRMSGYLKKKRIKVGGWKKLWFILQNQLLLSYNSKEDYEERLAPFKDVISLVPGTQILPMHQNRFTIETTSKVLYIFRCDDGKSCSEWINALIESLNGLHEKHTPLNADIKFHIPKPMFCDGSSSGLVLTRKLADVSQQFDSLSFAGNEFLRGNKQIARLPIAPVTAKILERRSFHEDSEEDELNHILNSRGCEITVQNFRLHDEFSIKHAENQSVDVSRINSMFHEFTALKQHHSQKQQHKHFHDYQQHEYSMNESDCVENVHFQSLIKCKIVQNCEPDQNIQSDAYNNPKDILNDEKKGCEFLTTTLFNDTGTSDNTYKVEPVDKQALPKLDTEQFKEKIKQRRIQKKNSFLNQVANGKTVFENMKKFIVRKTSATDLNRNVNQAVQTNGNLNGKSDANEVKNTVEYCDVEEQIQNITLEDEDDITEYEDENENGQKHKSYVNMNKPSPIIKRNSYKNIVEIEIPQIESQKNSIKDIGATLLDNNHEPVVYATVNLEDKHSRRAQRSQSSPASTIDSNNDTPRKLSASKTTSVIQNSSVGEYEEVGMYVGSDGSEDETIYEPVEIPKNSSGTQALWQNIKKINVDALWLDLTRKIRDTHKQKGDNEPSANLGTFREFKKKLGDQRRSLKARVQKMYQRSDSRQSSVDEKEMNGDRTSVCSSTLSHNSSNGTAIPLPGLANAKLFAVSDNLLRDFRNTSGNKSKGSKLKAKFTFGSLGRVKKSRTSMFFEEFVPAKKINVEIPIDLKQELMSVCETKNTDNLQTSEKNENDDRHKISHESI